MSWSLGGRPLRRILVTRLRYLGDVAMSTVVLDVLRRGDPEVELGFLCEAAHAPILAGQPDLQRLHALDSRRRGRDAAARVPQTATELRSATGGTLATIMDLRRARYDLAVDLFFNPRSAWLLWLAGIPARIGGARSVSRRRLYTHQALSPTPQTRPELFRRAGGGLGEHLSRLAPLSHADGRPFLDWLEAEVAAGELAPRVVRPRPGGTVTAALTRLGTAPGLFSLLAPAATWPTKEWPVDRWRELIDRLLEAGRAPVVLSPPGDAERYAALTAAIPPGRGGVLPPLGLVEALQVVGAAREMVSVDGGVMHAGVAMRVPTIGLFGPTDPALWFPYEELGPYRVLATRPSCHPCDRHDCDAFVCLPDLAADRVIEALLGLDARSDVP